MLWVVQSASTSGSQRCVVLHEGDGINEVTVSNRENLVDPVSVDIVDTAYILKKGKTDRRTPWRSLVSRYLSTRLQLDICMV